MTFTQFVKNLHREESGQDLLEYALVLAAVLDGSCRRLSQPGN